MVKDKVTTKLEYFEKLWSSKNEVALLNALGMSNPPDGLSYLLRNKEKSNVKIVNYNTRSEANFVFVVPTANVDNKTSTDLRKQLKELPSIFVESTGENFNYAHSCNTGISEALNAGYNWIIICNDDIKFQESPHNLEKFINESNKNRVLTPDNRLSGNLKYHGETFSIFKTNPIILALVFYNIRWGFAGKRMPLDFLKNLIIRYPYLLKHFKYTIGVNNNEKVFARFSQRVSSQMINFSDFGIFPSEVLTKFKFDETFWNGTEDYDMVVRLKAANIEVNKIGLAVHSIGSATFGHSVRKNVVSLLDAIYFSHKFSEIDAFPVEDY